MFEYVSSGHFVSEDIFIHSERSIDSYEIIYIVKGTLNIYQEDILYSVKDNEVLLLDPFCRHFGDKKGDHVEFYWIHFKTDTPPAFKHFKPKESYEITSQIKRLLHIANTPEYPQSSLQAATLLLVNELNYQFLYNNSYTGNEFLTKIREYIRINSADTLTVEKVAKNFGYTPGYISKFYKSKSGMGLKQYIEEQRVKYAKKLLITTTMSIKEIAYGMGYDKESNFLKFFVYHEKISPAKYRNLYFNTHQNIK